MLRPFDSAQGPRQAPSSAFGYGVARRAMADRQHDNSLGNTSAPGVSFRAKSRNLEFFNSHSRAKRGGKTGSGLHISHSMGPGRDRPNARWSSRGAQVYNHPASAPDQEKLDFRRTPYPMSHKHLATDQRTTALSLFCPLGSNRRAKSSRFPTVTSSWGRSLYCNCSITLKQPQAKWGRSRLGLRYHASDEAGAGGTVDNTPNNRW